MSRYYLMTKPGEGEMYVPPEKLAEYQLDGWRIIEFPGGAAAAPSAAEDVEPGPTEAAPQKKTGKNK